MLYGLVFRRPDGFAPTEPAVLHFGSVDWFASVHLNGALLGNQTGGYSEFSFDALALQDEGNELVVCVHDPTELGAQPFGKQRVAAITAPGTGGNRYTPTSGIWQTVWLEQPPRARIDSVRVEADTFAIRVWPTVVGVARGGAAATLRLTVRALGAVIGVVTGAPGSQLEVAVDGARLWTPDDPCLYNLTVELISAAGGNGGGEAATLDAVHAYAGMRNVSIGPLVASSKRPIPATPGLNWPGGDLPNMPVNLSASASADECAALCNSTAACAAWAFGLPRCGPHSSNDARCWLKSVVNWKNEQRSNQCCVSGAKRAAASKASVLLLNGQRIFAAGWLDQSWWPDGLYTAPTDDALAFDIEAVKTFGPNTVRLHQKINPEWWYYHADRVGVLVLQDEVQHFEYPSEGGQRVSPALFKADWQAAIEGRRNHPCIIQWNVFNEFEFEPQYWNATEILEFTRALDASRLVNFNSGGPGNRLGLGDVNDVHSYPFPSDPQPSATQYAAVGEYGGIGWRPVGKEWLEDSCGHRAIIANSSADGARVIPEMVAGGAARSRHPQRRHHHGNHRR